MVLNAKKAVLLAIIANVIFGLVFFFFFSMKTETFVSYAVEELNNSPEFRRVAGGKVNEDKLVERKVIDNQQVILLWVKNSNKRFLVKVFNHFSENNRTPIDSFNILTVNKINQSLSPLH